MPITPTYPGIYIEELPSSARTITAAPTSLVPGATPASKPAILLESAISGARGNSIQIAFSNIVVDATTPANTTFDATITAKSNYSGLSFDSASSSFIKTVLGIETSVGTSPGLIRAKNAETPKQPKNGSYPLAGGGVSAKSNIQITGSSDPIAFTVEAWNNGAEGNNIVVTVSDVDTTAGVAESRYECPGHGNIVKFQVMY
jgi:hypothetical protein